MTKEGKDTSSPIEWMKRLRENKGGAFSTKVLKHGGSIRAIAATAAKQLFEIMRERKIDVVSIQRRYLVDMFGDNSLQPPKAGRPPTLKRSVTEHLAARGIRVEYSKRSGIIDFWKISPKKNPRL